MTKNQIKSNLIDELESKLNNTESSLNELKNESKDAEESETSLDNVSMY